jgi:tetratricopeptide (TPR) repeat protein
MAEWLDFSDLVEKAHELIDLGLYDEAEALLDRHAASFTGEWELYFLYSRCFAEQNKPGEAVPWLHKGLRLDPENVECLIGLFYAHAMMNRMPRARNYLFRAQEYHPGHELVLSALVWYYTETSDLNSAISCFERLRDQGIDNPETFRNAGTAYDRAGQYEKAVECFTAALELYPDYDEAREQLSDLYISAGKTGKAVELYQQALAVSPHNIRYLSHLTFCLAENGELEKAIADADESIRLYPNSPIGHVDLAYLHLNAGNLGKALASAEKALDIAPLDVESRRVKAIILSEQDDRAGAEAAFENAISLDPDNKETLRDYYHHLRRIGAHDKMEKIVARVIAPYDPSCVEEYWFLADYYKEKKEFLKAFEYLRKAYAIRPGEHEFLSLAADILLARGHAHFALRFLKRYVDIAGWNDVMDRFAVHPQLRKGPRQEALRYMRFCGSNMADFHRHVFGVYFRKTLAVAAGATLLAAAFPLTVVFGVKGLVYCAAAAFAVTMAFFIVTIIQRRKSGFPAGH